MGIISTQFILYHEINVEGIDLFEDAFGFYPEYTDVCELLRNCVVVPNESLIKNLIIKIRKNGLKEK